MLIDFELPEKLIATHPSQKRDHCKMLVVERASGKITHTTFNQLPNFLGHDYFLVLNQARVNHSRMFWTDSKGKRQEILFLKHLKDEADHSVWEAIVSGKKLEVGVPYALNESLHFQLIQPRENSIAHIQVNKTKAQLEEVLREHGQLPLPPYILKKRKQQGVENYTQADEKNYQTVFSKSSGAVAAPTAGLHFTDKTFAELKLKGVGWDFVHLSVGWGTFAPLTKENFETKKLHKEFCSIPSHTALNILDAKRNGKKILAVGTTVVRTLESWAKFGMNAKGFEGDTDLFITPPHSFTIPNAMLTNFHIPQSSLLLLVAAFLGKDGEKRIIEIYNEAIAKEYQFYSYGDCMLIV
ncbi:MAG: tRNA preQ1(34) S-adenosylmethionine ribosyltransferase-isomerase QueA [Bdellovibrionota bacterium]